MLSYHLVGKLPKMLPISRLVRIAKICGPLPVWKGKSGIIGVRFVSAAEIQCLNHAFRGINHPTDVLSFSALEGKRFPTGKDPEREIGDIVICASYARKEAKQRAVDPQEELVRLLIHGTLHLAGMDHERLKDEKNMFSLQERLIRLVQK